jgi:extracellular elastinolytic metalloproteinase
MRRILVLLLLAPAFAAFAAAAQDEPASFRADMARVYRAAAGKALAAPSGAASQTVSRFLQAHGVSAATLATVSTVAQEKSRNGITHVRMEQSVGGLRVEGAYVKASVNARGELISVIEQLARVPGASTGIAPATATEAQALGAALWSLRLTVAVPSVGSREGHITRFEAGSFFYQPPTVERVAIAMKSGALREGFLVTTWTAKTNLLQETLVSGSGRVLSSELRTNNDSYKVFTESPDAGAQTVLAGPGAGNAESPAGWLSGSQLTLNISGNNAHAYLDADANDRPDPGGAAITDGNFLATIDLTKAPDDPATSNREVAVQNLFYLNNVIHDTLYRAGFDEAAGNFQEDNFGNGGAGGDSVNAEAQDGSGTDNANFSTPRDGRNGRMQMYLWTGKGTHQVVVGGNTYNASGAVFGPALDTTGITDNIAIADDGSGISSTDACESITSNVAGAIALADRGNCDFVVKVKNAQLAGAVGVIIANNVGADSIFTMGGRDRSITIPSVMVGKDDGATIRGLAGQTGTIRLAPVQPLQRDGDIDSDIVWHEYGHGLTWRMIGRMSGAMSGAVGEGMSDVLAVIENGDDVVAEYAATDSFGLRSAPYDGYFSYRTYGDVTGSEIHFDGEVYGAIGWELYKNYTGAGLTKDQLLADLVDGMNYTPAGPAFEDMRDGILASIAASGNGHECLVWGAFADGGVGVGATSVTRGSNITVTESFDKPAACQP